MKRYIVQGPEMSQAQELWPQAVPMELGCTKLLVSEYVN